MLFITTTFFGQAFLRSYSFVEATPTGNNTIEDAIHLWNVSADDDFKWIPYVHFVKNDRLFLLSYEPNGRRGDGLNRDIYLYCKDINDINSSWDKASDVVMTSIWIDHNNYNEIDFYAYDKDQHNTSIGKVVEENDCFIITVKFESMVNGRVLINEPITIIFKPIGDNLYSHSKFE